MVQDPDYRADLKEIAAWLDKDGDKIELMAMVDEDVLPPRRLKTSRRHQVRNLLRSV